LYLLKENSSFIKKKGSRTSLRDVRIADVQERHKEEITILILETDILATDGKQWGELIALLLNLILLNISNLYDGLV